MEANQDILDAFRLLPASRQSQFERVIEEYTAACELSEGPHPGRTKHWQTRAWELEDYLKKRLTIV